MRILATLFSTLLLIAPALAKDLTDLEYKELLYKMTSQSAETLSKEASFMREVCPYIYQREAAVKLRNPTGYMAPIALKLCDQTKASWAQVQ